MDVAGLALGIAGIAGLFSTCLDCFQLIQRGRAFEKDYRILETKLDNQELRFSAWGRACGLIDIIEGGSNPLESMPEIKTRIQKTLECIRELFQDEKELKKRYGLRPLEEAPSGSSAGLLTDAQSGSDSVASRRGIGTFFLRKKQQRAVGFFGSARWAICDRDKLSELINHLKDFNDDLEAMTRIMDIPRKQRIIVEYEVEEITELEVLEEVADAGADDSDVVSDTASHRLVMIYEGSEIISIRSMSMRASLDSSRDSFFTGPSMVSLLSNGTRTTNGTGTGSFVTARSEISQTFETVVSRTQIIQGGGGGNLKIRLH
jgi:hypothetical protein